MLDVFAMLGWRKTGRQNGVKRPPCEASTHSAHNHVSFVQLWRHLQEKPLGFSFTRSKSKYCEFHRRGPSKQDSDVLIALHFSFFSFSCVCSSGLLTRRLAENESSEMFYSN